MPSFCPSAGFARAIDSGRALWVACLPAWPNPPRSNHNWGEVSEGGLAPLRVLYGVST
jgi:hypothetical protein